MLTKAGEMVMPLYFGRLEEAEQNSTYRPLSKRSCAFIYKTCVLFRQVALFYYSHTKREKDKSLCFNKYFLGT